MSAGLAALRRMGWYRMVPTRSSPVLTRYRSQALSARPLLATLVPPKSSHNPLPPLTSQRPLYLFVRHSRQQGPTRSSHTYFSSWFIWYFQPNSHVFFIPLLPELTSTPSCAFINVWRGGGDEKEVLSRGKFIHWFINPSGLNSAFSERVHQSKARRFHITR